MPTFTRSAAFPVELAVHHVWGLAKSYYRTSVEAYAAADALIAAGWSVSIAVLP